LIDWLNQIIYSSMHQILVRKYWNCKINLEKHE
jgi:hypothetical protein